MVNRQNCRAMSVWYTMAAFIKLILIKCRHQILFAWTFRLSIFAFVQQNTKKKLCLKNPGENNVAKICDKFNSIFVLATFRKRFTGVKQDTNKFVFFPSYIFLESNASYCIHETLSVTKWVRPKVVWCDTLCHWTLQMVHCLRGWWKKKYGRVKLFGSNLKALREKQIRHLVLKPHNDVYIQFDSTKLSSMSFSKENCSYKMVYLSQWQDKLELFENFAISYLIENECQTCVRLAYDRQRIPSNCMV